MLIDEILVEEVLAITKDVIDVLGPLIQLWISSGDTDAIRELSKVIQEPSVLQKLDAALELAQRTKAAKELGA